MHVLNADKTNRVCTVLLTDEEVLVILRALGEYHTYPNEYETCNNLRTNLVARYIAR